MTENVETEVAHFSGKMNGFKGDGERERERERERFVVKQNAPREEFP